MEAIIETRDTARGITYDIVNGEYIFLLLKTKYGYWQNPQGGIDPGESEIGAIVRELVEETGLKYEEMFLNSRHFIEYDTTRTKEEM